MHVTKKMSNNAELFAKLTEILKMESEADKVKKDLYKRVKNPTAFETEGYKRALDAHVATLTPEQKEMFRKDKTFKNTILKRAERWYKKVLDELKRDQVPKAFCVEEFEKSFTEVLQQKEDAQQKLHDHLMLLKENEEIYLAYRDDTEPIKKAIVKSLPIEEQKMYHNGNRKIHGKVRMQKMRYLEKAGIKVKTQLQETKSCAKRQRTDDAEDVTPSSKKITQEHQNDGMISLENVVQETKQNYSTSTLQQPSPQPEQDECNYYDSDDYFSESSWHYSDSE